MNIAIKGHLKRGKEVIQILESLGGKSREELTGRRISHYYFINCNGDIDLNLKINLLNRKLYTLEEFEKEFPFKIGDKVTTTGTKHPKIITGITDTQWGLRYVISEIKFPDSKEMPHTSQISLYKEVKEERNITLTLEKAKEWYKKGGELKEIALQAFTEKELNPLPKSWEEFRENNPVKAGECWLAQQDIIHQASDSSNRIFKNWIPSKKSAEAHLAMIQLKQLRDCWIQDWEPDWNDIKQAKFCVCYFRGKFKITTLYETRCFLSFPTYDLALKFLECFKDLLEQAGNLI